MFVQKDLEKARKELLIAEKSKINEVKLKLFNKFLRDL